MWEFAQGARDALAYHLRHGLDDAADELQGIPAHPTHSRTVSLAIIAGSCFLLGFLCARASRPPV